MQNRSSLRRTSIPSRQPQQRPWWHDHEALVRSVLTLAVAFTALGIIVYRAGDPEVARWAPNIIAVLFGYWLRGAMPSRGG